MEAGMKARPSQHRTLRTPGGRAAALFLVLAAIVMAAAAPVPRSAPELAIVEPSGRQMPLSSLKGKVVVIEFLLTRCPHCWRMAKTLGKLHQELGKQGFQAVGVTFDNAVNAPLVSRFVASSGVTFPVGYTTADKVDSFLGREAAEKLQVPQLVVIDRAGVIVAQSRSRGEPSLEDEAYLRALIARLLAAGAPPAAPPAQH
jgi:peroxiredoxin